MSHVTIRDFWKPPKEAKAAIARGDRKVREAHSGVCECESGDDQYVCASKRNLNALECRCACHGRRSA